MNALAFFAENYSKQITSGIIWKVLAISGGQLAILLAILKLFAT